MLISKCFRYLVQYPIYWAARCSYPSRNVRHVPTPVGTQQQHLTSCKHLISCTLISTFDIMYLWVLMSSTISIMLCFKIELYVCWYQSVFDIWCNTQQVWMSSTISNMVDLEIELYSCWSQSIFDIWCNTQYIELPGVPTLVGTYTMCLPPLARSNNIWHHANIWYHVPSSVDVQYDIQYGGLGNWVVFMLISKCFRYLVQYPIYWAARCSYPSWNVCHVPTLGGTPHGIHLM